MKKKTLLLLVAVFVLFIALAAALYGYLTRDGGADNLASADIGDETADRVDAAEREDAPQQEDLPQQEETSPESQLAPDFTVYDGAGNPVNLSDFRGKPVVVNFWASWCGPCQGEMPDFEEKYRELGDEVVFLMVNMTDGGRETVETARSFIEDTGYTFPVYYDTEGMAAAIYGVYSIPSSYFIDAEGNAVAYAMGAIDGATLQQGIDMIR